MKKGNDLKYVHQDHLSGTSMVTSDIGSLIESIKYCSFGEIRSLAGTDATDKKFTGQRLDGTGLYYYGARYYDPTIGRFISADPIVHNVPLPEGRIIEPLVVSLSNTQNQFKGNETRSLYQEIANPQELNRYSYVLNNPLKYIDPDGHQVEAVAVVVGGGVLVYGFAYYYLVIVPALKQQGVDTSINDAISYAWDNAKKNVNYLKEAAGGLLNNLNPFKNNDNKNSEKRNTIDENRTDHIFRDAE